MIQRVGLHLIDSALTPAMAGARGAFQVASERRGAQRSIGSHEWVLLHHRPGGHDAAEPEHQPHAPHQASRNQAGIRTASCRHAEFQLPLFFFCGSFGVSALGPESQGSFWSTKLASTQAAIPGAKTPTAETCVQNVTHWL